VNAFLVEHGVDAGPETLGTSRGQADQRYHLRQVPVVTDSTQLRLVSGGSTDTSWAEVHSWDRSGPLDHHYLLDPETGQITFGNGRRGSVPPAGWGIEALGYRVGGGWLGNVPAGALSEIRSPAQPLVSIVQRVDAIGGAPAESIDRAHGRALDELARPMRAITSSDFEALALEVPGVPVARAAVWPGYHADYACLHAPGVVTVVVLPACGSPPMPGPEFLAVVRAYLNRRRPLTTEVRVVGPGYVPVTVTATLHAPRLLPDLGDQAQTALDHFFDPLTGGAQGKGWPFGRAVIASEVMSVLAELPGVTFVDQLALTGGDPAQALCVNLPLCPTELVASQKHRITVVEG